MISKSRILQVSRDLAKIIWHILPIDWRRRLVSKWNSARFQKIAASIPPIKDYEERPIKKIGIIGLFSDSLGLSRAAKLLVQELIYNGIEIYELDCNSIIEESNNKQKIDYDIIKNLDAIIIAVNPDIATSVLLKLKAECLLRKKIIGFWVWELPCPPKNWGSMNHLVHEIWTPSNFSKNALSQIFNKPIKVINHPVALIDPPKIDIDARQKIRARHNIEKDAFVAFQSFAFSSSIERKNIIEAIRIFAEAFKNDQNARFIIRYAGEINFVKALENLIIECKKYDGKIILIKSCEHERELFEYYAASDVYISLHRSEGFGLNIAEAMLIGLPVITTKWSGNLEFCKNDNAILIDYDLIKVIDKDGIYLVKNGKWASPKHDDAVKKLRILSQNRELRLILSNNSKKFIHDNLGAKKLF